MITLKVKNIEGVINGFKKYGSEAEKEFKEITQIRALEIEADAKTTASVKGVWDNGDLAQNIRASSILKYKGLAWEVGAYMPYSAYHEFGTGGLVNIPSGWEKMAEQFRGKGIRQINIQARPFMYPAFVKGSKLYIKDLKNSIKRLNKDFNNG